jgi:hypothetical protein
MEFSMSLRGSVLLLLSQTLFGLTLAGCAAPPPPPPPPAATSFDIFQLQSDLQRHDPGARAGSVIRIRSDAGLAAVSMAAGSGSSKQAVKVDDPITFTDSTQTPVANGTVVNIDGNELIVKYTPSAGGRAPQEGDIAVHLSSP